MHGGSESLLARGSDEADKLLSTKSVRPLRAKTLIRKMRGGAQSHLIKAEDGHLYVVKCTNNPQHRRILVNEWLASAFLRYLQIHVPETTAIQLTPKFIEESPDLYFSIGSRREPVLPGFHFGSRMSVNPGHVAIFDFLPDQLLNKIENVADFLGTLVFDKWVCNADSRQAVFFRARAKTWTPLKEKQTARVGFFAQMIDHGFAFNGPHWLFHDSPTRGPYFRSTVYREVQSLDSFQPWLNMVQTFPIEVIDAAWKTIPRDWLGADQSELEGLLESLIKRRTRIPQLIEELQRHKPTTFPNWSL